jgi:ice-binding like protein
MKLFKNRTAVCLLVLGSLIPLTFAGNIVAAGPPAVGLGTADAYGVLAGDNIANTGATTITGNLGLHPGSSVTGAPTVLGASNVANGAALQAKADLRTAYLDAQGRPAPILVAAGALGGRTLAPGLYKDDGAPASLGIATGQTLTLNGDASSVWIFQSASTLITETGSRVVLTGGAQACNVFWQVGSSATLKTSSTFVGTVMANTSITAQNSVTVAGRLLAGAQANGAGALTLDTDTITRTPCATVTPTTPTPTTPTPTTPTKPKPAPAKPKPAPAKPKPTPARPKPAAKKAAVAGGSTSVSGPALPPVSSAGFTG